MARILVLGSLAESLINFRGDLIRHLIAQGHTVVAAAPEGPAFVDEQLANWDAQRECIKLERTGSNVLADVRLVWQLRRLFLRTKPDVVLAYTIKPVVYGAIASRWAGVPRFAAMITGLGFTFAPAASVRQALVQTFARALYRIAMRRTALVFFQNRDDEAEFRANGLLHADQCVVFTNGSGVNLERFSRVAQPDGPLRFLMIARLLANKGVREYISAAREIKQLYPQVQFDLVGPFDSNPSAIQRHEIDEAVSCGAITYHGATNDVRPFLHDCHVYVLPSYSEGTPRSVLEAMAVGRPVITTDAPGCRETVVPGENGVLVTSASVPSLVSAMLSMIASDPVKLRYMADASRHLAETKFDVVAVNEQICTALIL
jgi:glycosyltransferase involved in cell wall biosynthesis